MDLASVVNVGPPKKIAAHAHMPQTLILFAGPIQRLMGESTSLTTILLMYGTRVPLTALGRCFPQGT